MSLLIVSLDVTIVNIALPSIRLDLRASISGLQWIISAYTLVLASLFLLSGSTADRFGRRKTFVLGLSIFVVGSLLCSIASSLTFLVIFRIVQAVGGSMLNPVAMSIVTNTFTDARERAMAIGVWASVMGISMALGPVVGGLLVNTIGWRSIFWINLPVGAAAIVLALMFIPESRAPRARRIDAGGQLLIILILAPLTFGIIEAPTRGWSSPLILGAVVVSGAAIAGLLYWEPRQHEPLIDLRFFHSIPFSAATLCAVAAFAALGGFLFLNTLFLQEVKGLSALHAGIDTLPMAIMTLVIPPLSGRMVGRSGSRLPLVIAGAFMSLSCLMLVNLSTTTSFSWIFAAYVLFGVGFGFVNAPITNAAVSGMPRAQAGVASAVASTSRQIGQTLGVAVVGALVAAKFHGLVASHLVSSSHLGWWLLSGCGFAIFVLGFVSTSKRAMESASHTAATLNPEAIQTPRRG